MGYEEIFSLLEPSNICVRPGFIAANQKESEESTFLVLLQSILLQIVLFAPNTSNIALATKCLALDA